MLQPRLFLALMSMCVRFVARRRAGRPSPHRRVCACLSITFYLPFYVAARACLRTYFALWPSVV